MTKSVKHTLHVMLLSGSFWIALSGYGAFIVTMITDFGYSATTASAIMTVMSVVAFAVQPVTGYLCDNYFSQRTVFVTLACFAIPLCLFLQTSMVSLPMLVAVMFLLTVTFRQIPGLIDSWIVRMQKDDPDLNYGWCRGTASLTYAASAMVMGRITAAFGHHTRLIITAMFIACTIVVALTLQDKKTERKEEVPAPVRKLSTKETFRIMLGNTTYLLLLVMAFVIFLGQTSTETFLPTLVKEMGGDSGFVGTMFSIVAFSEVPAMFLVARVLKRVKAKYVLTFAACMYLLRMVLTFFAKDLAFLVAVQALQGLSYAVFWPACMNYVREITEERVRSTSVMTFSSVTLGASGILGNAAGTLILSLTDNVRAVFIFTSCMVLVSLFISFYGYVKKIWK
ncbi:MAG: MFS transporter [Oscillospiraceae bacterium]|nr:MFS transporter [Oscillospiraceae bacterium]